MQGPPGVPIERAGSRTGVGGSNPSGGHGRGTTVLMAAGRIDALCRACAESKIDWWALISKETSLSPTADADSAFGRSAHAVPFNEVKDRGRATS